MKRFNVKLKEIVTISAGYPFRGRIIEAPDSSIHAIQMKDVSLELGIIWNKGMKTKLTGKANPTWLKPDDILFAARGSHNYAVLVDQAALKFQAVAAPHFYILSCISKQILPDFLAWLLNQDSCQRYYQREAEGTFTKSIRRSILEDTPITVPSLATQHSIIQLAKILKQEQQMLMQLIQNNNKLMNTIATNLL